MANVPDQENTPYLLFSWEMKVSGHEIKDFQLYLMADNTIKLMIGYIDTPTVFTYSFFDIDETERFIKQMQDSLNELKEML